MDHFKLKAPYDRCDVLRFTNESGGTIASGTWRVQGDLVGMVMQDVEDDAEGIMVVRVPDSGIIAPKASASVLDAGDLVYWDVADGEVNVDAVNNAPIGYALEAAGSGATEVRIALDNAYASAAA